MPTIRFLTQADLAEYLAAGDPLANYLGQVDSTSERWLHESPAKRMIAWKLYGDLFASARLRIADIGSGYSSIQKALAECHDYLAVDLGAHDTAWNLQFGDWRDLPDQELDLVIANDLFPNVDQGLEPFLEKFGCPLRLSLTVYADRYYRVKRADADELLTIKAWDWPQTQAVLLRHMQVPDISPPTESLFDNGRQICLVV